jgi:hypothetical protein
MKAQNKSPWRRDRRAEVRSKASEVVVIKSALAGVSLAEVTDFSPSGIRVTAPYPFPVGTEIEIVREEQPMLGCVRSCLRTRPNQFRLGIGNLKPAGSKSLERSEVWSQLDRLTDIKR